ncbi:hypothetical protein CHUAL_010186 [Chamberlinius hualienensis]
MADVIVVVNNAESSSNDDGPETMFSSSSNVVNANYSATNSNKGLVLGEVDNKSDEKSHYHGINGFGGVKTLNLSRIPNKLSLFGELEELLAFDHPRVRSECSDMISRIIPQLKHDLDTCMSIVTPQLVRNLGHEDEEVRLSAANTLAVYARHTPDIDNVFQQIIYAGLLDNTSQFSEQKRLIIESIPLLFTKELVNKDWHLIARSLQSLVANNDIGHLEASLTLDKLRELVGEKRFRLYTFEMDDFQKKENEQEDVYEFSFLDPVVVNLLMNKSDRKMRIKAVEELKRVVKDVSYADSIVSELPEFLVFLSELLDDSDFKVNLVTLEIYGILVDKLSWRLKKHLNRVVDDLVEHLGENKIVIRTQTSKVLRSLMASLGPSPVVTALCDNLMEVTHRRSCKMKEEILNVIIVALLSYPNYEFELRHICETVAPTVLDSRRRVRHAALECLAVLSQSMGSSKLAIMASAIDSAAETTNVNTEAALAAVLARLARRQIPRANDEGHLEYSLRVPSGRARTSASNQGSITSFPKGADVDWVMAGNGPGSPVPKTFKINDENINSKLDQSASFPSSPAAPRRIISPGHGKSNDIASWTHYDSTGNVRSVSITNLQSTASLNNSAERNKRINPHNRGNWLPPATLPSTSSWKNQPAIKHVKELEDTRFILDIEQPYSELARDVISSGGQHNILNYDTGFRGRQSSSRQSLVSLDRPVSRRLDKVAAMLGSNILPNKTWSTVDERPKVDTMADAKPMVLPSINNSTMSWSANDGGTFPVVHSKVVSEHSGNNSNHFIYEPPVPVRPTKVRSSSGGRKVRTNSNKSLQLNDFIYLDTKDNDTATNKNGWNNTQNSLSKSSDSDVDWATDGHQLSATNDSGLSIDSPNQHSNTKSWHKNISADSNEIEVSSADRIHHYNGGRRHLSSNYIGSSSRPKRRPRSLDLKESLPQLEVSEKQNLGRNLSSSSSESIIDYDSNNKVFSEMSSLNSSFEEHFSSIPNQRRSLSSPLEMKRTQSVENRTLVHNRNSDDLTSVMGFSNQSQDLTNSSYQLKETRNKFQLIDDIPVALAQHQEVDDFNSSPATETSLLQTSNVQSHLYDVNDTSDMAAQSYGDSNNFKTTPDYDDAVLYNYADKSDSLDDINVVGKGMLPLNISSNQQRNVARSHSPPVPALLSAREHGELPSIQGKNVTQLRSEALTTENKVSDFSSLSQSTFNKLMNKKLELMGEVEGRNLDFNQSLEKRKQQSKHNEFTRNTTDEVQNGYFSKNPPDKGSVTRRTARLHVGTANKPSDTTQKSLNLEERLMRNPVEALQTALTNIQNEDWSTKCRGIATISVLRERHPNVVTDNLHNVNLALLNEVKNLRSAVSRGAIQCFGDLFVAMKKNMDGDLDCICKVLLHKCGESNVFIKEDVEKSLTHMVENVTPQRALIALILGGCSHRNPAVRKITARFVFTVCENIGTNKIMSGAKDITDKVFLTATQFVMDGAPMTRYYGRKMLFMLLPHPEFDRMLMLHVPANTIRNIKDVLDSLKTKGVGSIPNESLSYKSIDRSYRFVHAFFPFSSLPYGTICEKNKKNDIL